nr:uncharacterized protein LOC107429364 isoform X6 [Ziziphus jujuba var. spinosa]
MPIQPALRLHQRHPTYRHVLSGQLLDRRPSLTLPQVSFEPVPNSFAVVKSSFASVITSTRTIYTRSHCRRSNLCLICSIFIWWMKLERYVLYQCFSLSSLFGKEFWGKILMGMNNVLAFGSAEVYYGWALEILLIQVCRNLRIKVKFNQLSTCLKLTQ